jgi:hypothetical protein
MRIILPIAVLLLCVSNLNAQLQVKTNAAFTKVGEINRTRVATIPEVLLEMSIQKSDSTNGLDTLYAIRFQDVSAASPLFSKAESRRYEVYFHSNGGGLEQLYDILLNVFTDKRYEAEHYSTIITLGKSTITIKRDFNASKPKIQVYVGDGMFTIHNTKELNWLFGKPKK